MTHHAVRAIERVRVGRRPRYRGVCACGFPTALRSTNAIARRALDSHITKETTKQEER